MHIAFIVLIIVGIIVTACGCAGPTFTNQTNVSAAVIFSREVSNYCAHPREKRMELDRTFRHWLEPGTDVLVKCPDDPQFF